MNNREYQDMPGVSSHRLIAMQTSPAHCWRQYFDSDRPPEEATDALRLGTLVHCLALNPHTFDDEFLVADYDRRSNAGKERYAQLNQYGLTVIKPREFAKATALVATLKTNPDAHKLLRHGRKERTIIEPRAGGLLPLKARLDLHNEARRRVVELKTTRDLKALNSTIREYGYLVSAAFYQRISQSRNVVFIFVQTTEPYAVEIFDPTYGQLDQGREEMNTALEQFDQCWLANHWPEAEPAAPALEDDLMMPMPFMTATPNRQRFEMLVGKLAL